MLGLICFLLNVNEILHIPGLLILSICLMLIPGIYIILNNTYEYKNFESFIIIFIPIIVLSYVYSLKMGSPVGYQDTFTHMFQYFRMFSDTGKIIFENAQNVSYNFVGMYIIYLFVSDIANLDLMSLVPLISPFFNLVQSLIVYLIIKRLFSHKIALLSLFFFGWNYQILSFGNDMRTQTIGVILLFLFIAFMLIVKMKKSDEISKNLVLILILLSIVTTSFVSILYTLILIMGFLVSSLILSKHFKWKKENHDFQLFNIIILFFIFFIFYMIYIGISFDNVLIALQSLYKDSLQSSGSFVIAASGTLYGNFVLFSQRIIYLVLFGSSILFIRYILQEKKFTIAVIFSGFFSLYLYAIVNTIIGALSPARIYVVAFIAFASILSFGLIKSKNLFKNRNLHNLFIYGFVILFAFSNVLQFPAYIIGETTPLRGTESIDHVYYWDSNTQQYGASKFLNFSSNTSLRTDMVIINHLTLSIAESNNLTLLNYFKTNLDDKSLIILHDKFKGQNYTNRDTYPAFKSYSTNNMVYDNGDYIIYKYRLLINNN